MNLMKGKSHIRLDMPERSSALLPPINLLREQITVFGTFGLSLSHCIYLSVSLSVCHALTLSLSRAAVVCVSGRMLLLLMLHMVVYRRTLSTGGSDLELERGKVRERKRGARYARDGNQSRRPAHDDDDDEKIIRFDSVY